MYTRPAKASKYNDIEGILEHYDGVLSELEGDWIWVFDSKGFQMKHLLEVQVGIQLAKLITRKHSQNLKKIVIINPTWYIRAVLDIVNPFLTKHVRELIQIKRTGNQL
jgi:hypothetical protein